MYQGHEPPAVGLRSDLRSLRQNAARGLISTMELSMHVPHKQFLGAPFIEQRRPKSGLDNAAP